MKTFSYRFKIREHHLDTFGHVNNATYLALFEEARWELLVEGGIDMEHIKRSGIGPVILEVEMKFRREVRNRENVEIVTRFSQFEGKVGRLQQVLMKEDGEEACTADFVVGVFDLRQRKLIEPPPEWRRLSE